MTQLHAGGKFDSDAYAISGGLQWRRRTVNARFTRLEVEIKRDGYEGLRFMRSRNPRLGGADQEDGVNGAVLGPTRCFRNHGIRLKRRPPAARVMAFLNKGLDHRT